MKVLVTGGAGYLGSIFVPELLRHGHQVTVIDNFMFNQSSLLDACHYPTLTLIRGDVRDKELMASHIAKADAIFPLACPTGAPLCKRDPIGATTTVVDAIKMMLSLRSPSQMIIYPTTNSGYGVGEKGKFCTEDTPLRPISLYGKLKTEAEKLILDSGNSITVRLATVFGVSPRMRLDLLVNDFTARAFYDRFVVLFEGHFKRNYIHVRDVARAFFHCIENFDKMKGQPYNWGLSDANLSKIELCEEIKKHLPEFYFVEAKVGEDPDKRDYIVSNERIEKTGLKPTFTLSHGIQELKRSFEIIRRNQHGNV